MCDGCEPTTWFYWYPTGEAGAGVEFRNGHVTGVYTLGPKLGWRTDDGLKVGGYMSTQGAPREERVEELPGLQRQAREVAGTPSPRSSRVGPMVYGFSLTRPSESVCR